MRHAKGLRKLNRTAAHRRAMFRNLATALVLHDQIETTLPKAKELRAVADKLVTLGKKNTLHARRLAMTMLYAINRTAEGNAEKLTAVHKLFTEIAPRFADRQGGYTRVVRTRIRPGDKTQMAMIQFVEGQTQKKERRQRRAVKKVEAPVATTGAQAPAAEEV